MFWENPSGLQRIQARARRLYQSILCYRHAYQSKNAAAAFRFRRGPLRNWDCHCLPDALLWRAKESRVMLAALDLILKLPKEETATLLLLADSQKIHQKKKKQWR